MKILQGTLALITATLGLLVLINVAHATVMNVTPSFSPSSIDPGEPSTLEIQFSQDSAGALTEGGITVTLPNGLLVYSTPTVSDTCGFSGGPVAGAAGSFTLKGGTVPVFTVGGTGICVYPFKVTSRSAGGS